jgi:hypothetical protein
MRVEDLRVAWKQRGIVETSGTRHSAVLTTVKLDTLPYDGLENGRAALASFSAVASGAVLRAS